MRRDPDAGLVTPDTRKERHVRAIVDGAVIAEARDDDIVAIEGNYYFPPSTVSRTVLKDSPTRYTCPWKGAARYHDVVTDAGVLRDAAWSYPTLEASALDRVGVDFSGYVAFDEAQVMVQESGAD